ncbi:MAG: TatD family hydrolase [Alphaproteobacteria bacterium]|nr:TatD family hydrolase [Alphaproteobacteria bacterium]
MAKYIDAHCHLMSNTEIVRARELGVAGMICNGTRPSDWGDIVHLVRGNNDVYGAIGVHPWFVDDLPDNWDLELRKTLIANPDLMIGEIGLDKTRPNIDMQISIFIRQLDMAYELKRVVHLHCVRAWDLILHILKQRQNKLPPLFVAHGYSGTPDMMSKLISDYNFYFSYGERALNMPCRIQQTPHDRILVESDGDTPANVVGIAMHVASIANITTDLIYENTTQVLQNG